MKTHTPRYVAHGCAIYTADDWRDGTNHGGKIVASTALNLIDAEHEDDMPENAESEFAEHIASVLNSHAALLAALEDLPELLNALAEDSQEAGYDARAEHAHFKAARARSALSLARGSNPSPTIDPRDAEIARLYEALLTCHNVLQSDFATPETPEGRRAIAAMNKARSFFAESEAAR